MKKALGFVVAVAAMAAAAGVCVVAAAFAVYAFLRYYLAPAEAAAAIALAAALAALILAFVAYRKVKPGRSKRDEEDLAGRLIELARERPMIAAGAAAAAGLVLLRNPGVVTAIVTAILASRARDADRRRGRRR